MREVAGPKPTRKQTQEAVELVEGVIKTLKNEKFNFIGEKVFKTFKKDIAKTFTVLVDGIGECTSYRNLEEYIRADIRQEMATAGEILGIPRREFIFKL